MARIIPVLEYSNSDLDVKKTQDRVDMFHETFKPVMTMLKCFGIYFDIDKQGFGNTKWTWNRIYCALVMCIVWLGFARSCYPYRYQSEFGAVLFTKLINSAWSLACAAQITFWYWSCFEALPSYIKLWSQLYNSDNCQDCPITTKKKAWILVVVSLGLITFSQAISMYMTFNTEFLDTMILPLKKQHTYYVPGVIFIQIATLLQNGGWILPVFVYFMMTSSVTRSFNNLNKEIEESVEVSNSAKTLLDLRTYRLRHEGIIKLSQAADRTLNFQSTVIVICNAVILCLALCTIIWHDPVRQDGLSFFSMMFWIVCPAAYIYVVVIGGSRVNDSAHASIDSLHQLDVQKVKGSSNLALELTLFIQRLNGHPIGLSAMNLFMLDSNAILTISGMLITYFVLLIQFKPPDDSETVCNCNCTMS